MRTLMVCALTPERLLSKAEIAQACNASQNHLAHVIVDLSRLGLIHTVRGRNGGVCLAKTPSEISLGLVVRALESRSPLVDCFDPARARCRSPRHAGSMACWTPRWRRFTACSTCAIWPI